MLLTWTVVPAPEGQLGHGLDAEVQRLGLLETANPGLDEAEAAKLSCTPNIERRAAGTVRCRQSARLDVCCRR